MGKRLKIPRPQWRSRGVSEATEGTAVQTSLLRADRHKLQQGHGLTALLGGSKTTPSPELRCYIRPQESAEVCRPSATWAHLSYLTTHIQSAYPSILSGRMVLIQSVIYSGLHPSEVYRDDSALKYSYQNSKKKSHRRQLILVVYQLTRLWIFGMIQKLKGK